MAFGQNVPSCDPLNNNNTEEAITPPPVEDGYNW